MNKENLKKLADYLDTLPPDYIGFDMTFFQCGTVGCAVGHGPAAGIPRKYDEPWVFYSQRVFIEGSKPNDNLHWGWCFSGSWSRVDNSIKGAVMRIRYLIEHGDVPPWYREAIRVLKPSSYKLPYSKWRYADEQG